MKFLTLSLCIVGLLSGCLELKTTVQEHKSAASPDGKFVARALFIDSGAVSSHDQLVIITAPDWKYEKDMELSPFRVASFERVADSDIDFAWADAKTLTVRFTQYGEGSVFYRSQHNGVQIFIDHRRKK
jgi:hypothetical protein